jgi:hypothetical protein
MYNTQGKNNNLKQNVKTDSSIQTEDVSLETIDILENYYLFLEKEIVLDKTIDFDELAKMDICQINIVLSDNELVNKYFREILKYLKIYSFVKFNYFQLKVIFLKIGVPDQHYRINDYVRVVIKPIMCEDIAYLCSFMSVKPTKIFEELTENNSDDIFMHEKLDIVTKCIARLNYKLTEKFGIVTTCIYTKNSNTNYMNSDVLDYNIFEIINLLRIIYRIVPICY